MVYTTAVVFRYSRNTSISDASSRIRQARNKYGRLQSLQNITDYTTMQNILYLLYFRPGMSIRRHKVANKLVYFQQIKWVFYISNKYKTQINKQEQ